MIQTLRQFGASLVLFVLLDFIWLGFVVGGFNTEQLRHIGRMVNGRFAIHYPAAAGVYILMSLVVAVFLLPKIGDGGLIRAASLGALMGFCIYGIFDMTNFAILNEYPLAFALMDIAWGTFLFALVATILSYGKV